MTNALVGLKIQQFWSMRKHLTYEWMGDSNCIEHIFHNVKKRIKMKCDIGKLWRRTGPRKEGVHKGM